MWVCIKKEGLEKDGWYERMNSLEFRTQTVLNTLVTSGDRIEQVHLGLLETLLGYPIV